MKILFLCHKMPYPPNDGGAIATLNMIKGFRELNATIDVLAMQTHKHSFSIQELSDEEKRKISWHQVWLDTSIKPFKLLVNFLFSKKPYNAVRFQSKEYEKKIVELFAKEEFDIIQLEGAYLASYVELIKNHSKAMISLRAHNVEYEIWQRLAKNENSFLKKAYYKVLANRVQRMEENLLTEIDVLVPISQRDAVVLDFKNNEKVHVSPTGIEASKFIKNSDSTSKTLFHIGALDWIPNQEGLLWFVKNVWLKIKKEHDDWDFVIAGRNASADFEKELKKFPINYIGEVEDAHNFIDSHRLMIVPLFSGSGMRIKIIEGMARGKCILTTPVGAEGIPAENNKEIFICNNAEEWVKNILYLINNNDQIVVCGNNAFNFAQQNYNNQTLTSKLFEFYQKQL
ncbi:MAG: glycosyltransferase [Salinivirgaceae bacterium]|nr:glycosyltransferase [Salinivirgaceae bacterium]